MEAIASKTTDAAADIPGFGDGSLINLWNIKSSITYVAFPGPPKVV